ncbi:hypothetical protein KP509_15G002500 [Ceratopteris richardii]|uniref:Retrovirus-related Pol polyprotein from transposon TNT 1-94-like beta-barrel domain-containing protein n=1 Tax=Ceratopteris richardii TaxID=49495 RepID=A0A8T2T400_CERRI|nr:hypothetical protein KP509_15G002500 [Ceratopteris richardii]
MAQAPAPRMYKIDKLHGTNFQPWKLTMGMVIQNLGLLPVIDGSEACPDRQDPNQANAVKAWDEQDLNARLELLLHMTDSVWQHLEATYEAISITHQVNCLKQLLSFTMKEGYAVENFIQSKLDDLLLAGLPISIEVQLVMLLSTLPSSFQPFVSTISIQANLCVPVTHERRWSWVLDNIIAFMATLAFPPLSTDAWILDSGATCHLMGCKDLLNNYKPLSKPLEVRFGNNSIQLAIGSGSTPIELADGERILIHDGLYVPQVSQNLISMSKLTSSHTLLLFTESACIITHKLFFYLISEVC